MLACQRLPPSSRPGHAAHRRSLQLPQLGMARGSAEEGAAPQLMPTSLTVRAQLSLRAASTAHSSQRKMKRSLYHTCSRLRYRTRFCVCSCKPPQEQRRRWVAILSCLRSHRRRPNCSQLALPGLPRLMAVLGVTAESIRKCGAPCTSHLLHTLCTSASSTGPAHTNSRSWRRMHSCCRQQALGHTRRHAPTARLQARQLRTLLRIRHHAAGLRSVTTVGAACHHRHCRLPAQRGRPQTCPQVVGQVLGGLPALPATPLAAVSATTSPPQQAAATCSARRVNQRQRRPTQQLRAVRHRRLRSNSRRDRRRGRSRNT
jgi:hypothetical protein